MLVLMSMGENVQGTFCMQGTYAKAAGSEISDSKGGILLSNNDKSNKRQSLKMLDKNSLIKNQTIVDIWTIFQSG